MERQNDGVPRMGDAVRERTFVPRRVQTPQEEVANSVSHGVGLVAALAAGPFLIAHAADIGGATFVAGVSAFAATMVLLFLASTLYHALPRGEAKRVFRVIEHSAIFLVIAGTYTPFTLGALHGAWGWTLIVVVWVLATAGVLLKAVGGAGYPRLSIGLYLGMGWLILVAVRPLWLVVPPSGLAWLLVGGIAYTVGVACYAAQRIPYAHFVWHLFVLAGATSHYVAVRFYAA